MIFLTFFIKIIFINICLLTVYSWFYILEMQHKYSNKVLWFYIRKLFEHKFINKVVRWKKKENLKCFCLENRIVVLETHPASIWYLRRTRIRSKESSVTPWLHPIMDIPKPWLLNMHDLHAHIVIIRLENANTVVIFT